MVAGRQGLKAHPLVVELWRRDSYENDVCLGLALLQMHKLVDAPPTTSRTVEPTGYGNAAQIQSHDAYFDILAPGAVTPAQAAAGYRGSGGKTVGTLRAILQLEDFGPYSDGAQGPGATPC